MDNIFNILFLKCEWTKDKADEFLNENEFIYEDLEDITECLCYTINKNVDSKPSRLIGLTKSVFLIVEDLPTTNSDTSDDEDEKQDLKDIEMVKKVLE